MITRDYEAAAKDALEMVDSDDEEFNELRCRYWSSCRGLQRRA